MLRASIEAAGDASFDLHGVLDSGVSTGIPYGDLLARFAEAVVTRDPVLSDLREQIRTELGDEALVDAAGTAANFQRHVRVADAIGIPLGDLEQRSAQVRAELGLDRFRRDDATR